MRELADITACFVDHGGLYLPLCQKLAESYKRIIYYDPAEQAFPTINRAVIGDGFDKIERVESFWAYKNEIDLFVFPDSQGAALQKELRYQEFPVWGSADAETLEQSREKFHKILGEVGLRVPHFERVIGLAALRQHLKAQRDKYIKISKYRGSLETFHWRTWGDDEGALDQWAVKFGGVKEQIPFLVFDAIDTDLEIGADTYCVNGQFPKLMMDGFEAKDRGYFGTLKKYEEMPEQTKAVMEAFAPILGKLGHRNFWSVEIRVDGEQFYFIDPTPRGPIPGIGSQMEIYGNLAEIVAAGAEGDLVTATPSAHFSAECVLCQKSPKEAWGSIEVPAELKQWVKLGGACMVDGRTWFPPDESHDDEIGWIVAIGDTPTETIEKMLAQVKLLPDGVSAKTESLVELLQEIQSAEEQGIEFSKQKIPDPAIVVENP